MPSEIRKLLAADARIGDVKLPVASVSGGGARRLQAQAAPKRDGETFQDLGEDAEGVTFKSTLREDVWLDLREIMRAARVVPVVHPFFPMFKGRIHSMQYEATGRSHVEATIVVKEEGEHQAQPLSAVSEVRLGQAAAVVRAKADDVFQDLTAVGDLPDLPVSLVNASAALSDRYTSFDLVLISVERGDASFQDLSGAWNDLAAASSLLLSELALAAETNEELFFSDSDDLVPVLLWSAREAVLAAQTVEGVVWTTFTPTAPVMLMELAFDFLGLRTDAAVDSILDANPELIEVFYVPRGTPINLPVRITGT